MKTITLSIALLISLHSFAQTINIFHKGSFTPHIIKSFRKSGIMTESGFIPDSEIDSIQIAKTGPMVKGLRYYLLTKKSLPIDSPIKIIEQAPNNLLKSDFIKFTSQRDGGKALQLIGVGILATTSYLQIKYAKDNADGIKTAGYKLKQVPQGLPFIGFGFMGLGLIIDIGASKHLKK